MSTKSSAATIMAWNWVIQSVAKLKQVDSSTLTGLVKKAPAISDDLGNDTREMVSLKILESLFIHENEDMVDNDSLENDKISFDPSEHCEDVLHKILIETSEPMTELEREKWNLRPFILHKRASLPKSPLQKFKDLLLESNNPILESLKKRSSLEGEYISEFTKPEIDVNFNGQNTEVMDDLVSEIPANENKKLQETENSTREITEKEHEMSKIPEVDVKFNAQNTVVMDDLVWNPTKENNKLKEIKNSTRKITEKEDEMSKMPHVIGLEENTLMDHMDHIESKNLEQSCGDDVPQETMNDIKNLNFSEEFSDPKNDIPPNVSNIGPSVEEKAFMENGNQFEISSDSEKSDDDINDIAAKKSAFLSSQCTLSQDSVATIDSNEIFVCMKCNKNGEFLVCNSDSCPFRVHKSCMGSNATFDENGIFFCPFCAYSRAISKYLEVKKKASLARKDLQLFLSSGVKLEHTSNISSKKGGCLDTNESSPIGSFGEKVEINGGEDSTSRGKEDCASVDLPRRSTRQAGMPKRKFKEKENFESYAFTHSKRSHKRDPQYTSPKVNLGRRKSIWWTKSEEEILKEGIRRFPAVNNKIPWTDILDFGRDVFEKSRTTVDLKDKWRNICKETPASKKRKL